MESLCGKTHYTIMTTYPRLLRRVQAVLIDSLIIPVALFTTITLIGYFEVENIYIKAAGLILPLFLLEPMLIATTGGTIGHHVIGIRVQSSDSENNLNIILASIRFIIKALFGWLSFIFVLTTKRHQAIHDLISRSVVVNKSSSNLPATEALSERVVQEEGYKYPSRALRIFMMVIYILFAFVALSLLDGLLTSQQCLEHSRCSTLETIIILSLSIIWLANVGLIIVFGWQGRLLGCRRKRVE